MVAPILLLAGVGAGILFFAKGGLDQFKAFAETGGATQESRQKGTAVTPELQTGEGTVPIASGSLRTVNDIKGEDIIRTDIANKRKFNPATEKPPIQTVFNNPKEGGVLATQKGQIVGANLSVSSGQQFGTGQFGLNQKEVSNIRSQDFTDQEKQDIANLTLRFNRKSSSAQNVSDSPEEIIMKKREQEAIAKKVLGSQNFVRSGGQVTRGGFLIEEKGGLFGKSNFALGGKTPAEFEEQQREKAQIEMKLQENLILKQQRIESGEQVVQTIKKSGLNQKEFFQERGIALRGGNQLSALALGKILERTGGLSRTTINPIVEPVETVPTPLTSAQVFALSDAEKIARFRRGERFT